jgi:hypothetical protein
MNLDRHEYFRVAGAHVKPTSQAIRGCKFLMSLARLGAPRSPRRFLLLEGALEKVSSVFGFHALATAAMSLKRIT